jgi:hypothetical protein
VEKVLNGASHVSSSCVTPQLGFTLAPSSHDLSSATLFPALPPSPIGLDSLPFELLDLIWDHLELLCDAHDYAGALRACALTQSVWRDQAQQRLFRRFAVTARRGGHSDWIRLHQLIILDDESPLRALASGLAIHADRKLKVTAVFRDFVSHPRSPFRVFRIGLGWELQRFWDSDIELVPPEIDIESIPPCLYFRKDPLPPAMLHDIVSLSRRTSDQEYDNHTICRLVTSNNDDELGPLTHTHSDVLKRLRVLIVHYPLDANSHTMFCSILARCTGLEALVLRINVALFAGDWVPEPDLGIICVHTLRFELGVVTPQDLSRCLAFATRVLANTSFPALHTLEVLVICLESDRQKWALEPTRLESTSGAEALSPLRRPNIRVTVGFKFSEMVPFAPLFVRAFGAKRPEAVQFRWVHVTGNNGRVLSREVRSGFCPRTSNC